MRTDRNAVQDGQEMLGRGAVPGAAGGPALEATQEGSQQLVSSGEAFSLTLQCRHSYWDLLSFHFF